MNFIFFFILFFFVVELGFQYSVYDWDFPRFCDHHACGRRLHYAVSLKNYHHYFIVDSQATIYVFHIMINIPLGMKLILTFISSSNTILNCLIFICYFYFRRNCSHNSNIFVDVSWDWNYLLSMEIIYLWLLFFFNFFACLLVWQCSHLGWRSRDELAVEEIHLLGALGHLRLAIDVRCQGQIVNNHETTLKLLLITILIITLIFITC